MEEMWGKYIIEPVEKYVPEDSRTHNPQASDEYYRMKNGVPPMTRGQLRQLPRYEHQPLTRWVKTTEREPDQNGSYLCIMGKAKRLLLLVYKDGKWTLSNGTDPFYEIIAWLCDVPEYED